MPAQTPSGWRMVSQSMPRATFSSDLAHQQRRHAAGKFDHLDAALHVAARLDERLAVLARVAADEVLEILLQQRFEFEKNARALDGGVSIQPGNAAAAASTASLTCAAVHSGASAMTSPVDGLWTGVVATSLISRHSPPNQTGQGSRVLVILKSSKFQAPSSREAPSIKHQRPCVRRIGAWFLGLLWSLEVGAWMFHFLKMLANIRCNSFASR